MEDLKKELEEELKLNTEDPRSHAWYQGAVSREVYTQYTPYTHTIHPPPPHTHTHPVCVQGAESLLQRDGDFLVRDSSSSPGDYVLSCCWRNEPMHFKIIRVVLRPKKVECVVCVVWSCLTSLVGTKCIEKHDKLDLVCMCVCVCVCVYVCVYVCVCVCV